MDPKKRSANIGGKKTKVFPNKNILESLKDLGTSTGQTFKRDVLEGTSKDFLRQLLGQNFEPRKVSGNLRPGESVGIEDAYSGKQESLVKEKRQLQFLNKLNDEERQMQSFKSHELKLQLNALQEELIVLATTTVNLAEETKVAAMSAPVEPSVYEVNRIEKMILFIKSFRIDAANASLWMHESNKRAQKKNFWTKYKNKKTGGSQTLLNPEDYNQRQG